MKTLFDQLTATELDSIALLVGFPRSGPGLKNVLREIEALPLDFKLGDAVVAFLEHQLAIYKGYQAERQAEALAS